MASLKSESGHDAVNFIILFVFAYLAVGMGLTGIEALGIALPLSEEPLLRLLEIILFGSASFMVMQFVGVTLWVVVRNLVVVIARAIVANGSKALRELRIKLFPMISAFERGGSGQYRSRTAEQVAPADAFAIACQTLGLASDGSFTQAEFKARYQAVIKAVHPDVIGLSALAAQVNEARDLINSRKGWK